MWHITFELDTTDMWTSTYVEDLLRGLKNILEGGIGYGKNEISLRCIQSSEGEDSE
jgi:hypothetical protein